MLKVSFLFIRIKSKPIKCFQYNIYFKYMKINQYFILFSEQTFKRPKKIYRKRLGTYLKKNKFRLQLTKASFLQHIFIIYCILPKSCKFLDLGPYNLDARTHSIFHTIKKYFMYNIRL